MKSDVVREAIRARMDDCARRGVLPPPPPEPAELWSLLDGNGPSALLVALDYRQAREEHLNDVAARRARDLAHSELAYT